VHGPYDVPAEYRDLYRNSTHNLTAEEQIMFGYISEMDSVVGDVHDELVRQGLYENTLIIFSSDNGAPNHENVRGRNWPFRGYKTQIYEGGVRVPAFVSGGFLPISRRGTVSDELYHVTDWLPTILAAADGTQLDGVDGKNAWPSMSQGKASPRTEVIYSLSLPLPLPLPLFALNLRSVRLLQVIYNVP
jgi:arylsulfatase A-like enzyme